MRKTVERQADRRYTLYMTVQHPPDCCGAYGSSRLSTWYKARLASRFNHRPPPMQRAIDSGIRCRRRLTEPHIEGTIKSFVFVQYWINLVVRD